MSDYKLFTVVSGDMYLVKVIEETETSWKVQNPLKVKYKYNTELMPVFRYLAWQVIAEKDQPVDIDKSSVIMVGNAHKELEDVHQRIAIQFIPLEPDEDEDDDLDLKAVDEDVVLNNHKVVS